MSIGERITELRKSANLSQGQLASVMDVSRQAVSKWENDQSSPDTLKLIQLADVLSTDVEYLATGKQPTVAEPVVITKVEYQEKTVEKIVEKPVVTIVEKKIPQVIEKTVEKPVLRKITRIKYLRNPLEYALFGLACFAVGLILGKLIF